MTKKKPPSVVQPPTIEPVNPESATVKMPLGEVIGYVTNRCDVQSMTLIQKNNLRRLENGLIAAQAQLSNGKYVRTGQDAIKWFLESIGG